jgi:hypothetical protein
MRIAYISLHWPRKKASGIGRKIEEQLSAWRKAGNSVQFFSHRTNYPNSLELIDGESFVYRENPGFLGRVRTEIDRSRAIIQLINEVKKYSPDVIYLRWGMYVFPSQEIFKIAPVVMEINTNDVSQHEMLGRLLSTYNRLTRGIYLNCASGLVFTSNELANDDSFSTYQKLGIVIANGINLDENLPAPAPDNIRPRIGFIGTPDLDWQGVDKLVRLSNLCPELDIDVIGFDNMETRKTGDQNLFFHGYLAKEQSRNVLSRVDVGLGTLALHRKAMNEASSLKTREYLAYGIPVILPYKDTDLDDLSIDTILKISNSEDNIEQNWKLIKDFSFKMKGRRVNRDLIVLRIGSDQKESARLKFFQDCIIGKTTKK